MSGLEFFDENIPCLAACPVHTNAGMYVAAIADGDDEQAYLTARLPNPFASVCGRVCAAPCEDACRRGEIDRPIAIRALKRFVTEQFGPETGDQETWKKVAAPPAINLAQSVGIVGGGPAGMACAHDLRRLGYAVTVYEATDRLGGAMWLGIPEYRLDRDVLAADIDAIVAMGVDVEYNTRLGDDITLDELRKRHDAVFLGIGATLGRGLDMEGADADGVLKAIEFLINMNRGFAVDIGEHVVVVGGGDVAMDAARTALRAADYEDRAIPNSEASADRPSMTEAIDAARSAARAGATKITIMSLESREEMPAHDFEVEEAEHEGIEFVNRRGPSRITAVDGRVTGIDTTGVTSVFDENGRFAPVFDQDDVRHIEADTVILAIGQAIDLESLGSSGPEISERRTIKIDNDTGETSLGRRVVRRRRGQRSPHSHRRHRRRPHRGHQHSPIVRRRNRRRSPRAHGRAEAVPSTRRSVRPGRPCQRAHARYRSANGPGRGRAGVHTRTGPMRGQPVPPLLSPTSSSTPTHVCCVRCVPTCAQST